MKTLDEVVEYTRGLPEDLQERVRDYAKSLRGKRAKRPVGKMRLVSPELRVLIVRTDGR